MKTLLTITLTAIIAGVFLTKVNRVQNTADRVFFESGILYPTIRAAESIESDLLAGKNEEAKMKITAMSQALKDLSDNFKNFEASHLGDLTDQFNQIEQNLNTDRIG